MSTSITVTKQKVIAYIADSKYEYALRALLKMKNGFNAFKTVAKDIVRKEIASCSKDSALRNREERDLIDFKWSKVIKEMNSKTPLLKSVLIGACVLKKGESTLTKGEKRPLSIIPIIGSIMSQILFARNSRINAVQKIIGLQLWLAGCAREVYNSIFHLYYF